MSAMFSYRPGSAAAVVHGESALIVPDIHLASDLWTLMHAEGWRPMDLIERLSADGLAKTPDFGLIVLDAERATAVVRGATVVDVVTEDGHETIDGSTVVTWTERSFDRKHIASLRLSLGVAGGSELPVIGGVVPCCSIVFAVEEARAEDQLEPAPVVDDVPPPVSISQSSIEHEGDVPEETSPSEDDAGDQPPAPADPNATLADADETRFDAMFGATIAGRRLEDAAVRRPEHDDEPDPSSASPSRSLSPDVPVQPGDHAGDTISAAELARLKKRAHREPEGETPSAPPTVSATLEFSSGRTVGLDRPVVIGRSPRAHGSTSAELPQLVVLDNPYISGTHLIMAVEHDVVLATDLSSNGTLLTRPGGATVRLDKGRATTVSDGCTFSLSDDVTVRLSVSRGEQA